MQPTLAKKLARRLMALALLISPRNSRAWIRAMAAELDYIDGSSKALSWSIGCFGAALKQRFISLLSPGALVIETEGGMSKVAKISAIALVVASALFLFAPTFQQGLKLTAASWHPSDTAWFSKMRALGARAEKNNDAQTLAFVAMQLNGDWESNAGSTAAAEDRALRDNYANEAVRQQPQLTWIYCSLLNRDYLRGQSDPNDALWLAQLQKSDPTNAEVYAVEAAYYAPAHALGWNTAEDRALLVSAPGWLSRMAKAFDSTNYDSYISREADLDREVWLHRNLDDPSRLFSGTFGYRLWDFANFNLYSKYFLLTTAADAEAKGDLRTAEDDYGKVARLGELMELHGDTDIQTLFGIGLQKSANQHIQAILEKSGNAPAANLLAFQMELEQDIAHRISSQITPAKLESRYQTTDAWLMQLSLLGMAISLALLLSCGGYFALRRVVGFAGLQRVGAALASMGVVATILLFASTIAMYFGYSSYAVALREYLNTSNTRDAYSLLFRFTVLEELPARLYYSFQGVDFWYTVIALGGVIVVWILYRQISRTFRHSAPVQPAA